MPEEARQVLAGLAEYLNEFTLLELKSPSDTLRAGDFQTFLAYAMLYRAQNEPLLATDRLNLLVLAPHLTKPYREELRTLGVTPRQEKPGIWALEGGAVSHRTWLLETGVLAGLEHPLLTLFSPQFLSQGPQTYTQLRQGGYTELVVYLAQQIQQFRQKGAEFAMQHLGTEDEMEQALRNLVASLPPETRLEGLAPEQRLAGLSPKERVAGLSPKELLASLSSKDVLASLPPAERLAGLSPKELLANLSPEAKEALRKQTARRRSSCSSGMTCLRLGKDRLVLNWWCTWRSRSNNFARRERSSPCNTWEPKTRWNKPCAIWWLPCRPKHALPALTCATGGFPAARTTPGGAGSVRTSGGAGRKNAWRGCPSKTGCRG